MKLNNITSLILAALLIGLAFTATAQVRFILFEAPSTAEVVEMFGIEKLPSITEDNFYYLEPWLSNDQLGRLVTAIRENGGSVTTVAQLQDENTSNYSNELVNRVLPFFSLEDNRE